MAIELEDPLTGTSQTEAPPGVSNIPDPSASDILGMELDAQAAAAKAAQDEQQRQRILWGKLNTLYNWCKLHRETYYDGVFNECYNSYRLQVPDERRSGEWRSKINVPYAFANTEDVVPHLMEGIFGSDRPFRVKGEGDQELLEGHEKLLYHQITELMEMEEKWEEYERQKVIYGTTAAFVGFKTDFKKRKMWQNVSNPLDPTAAPVPQIVDVDVPAYVGPTFDVLDIYDLYPHPRATRDKMKILFWRQFRSMEWLKAAGRFKDLEKIDISAASSLPNVDSQIGERKYRTGSANNEMQPPGEKIYQVITVFDEEEQKVYSFLPQQNGLIIEEGDYPYFHGEMPIIFDWYTPLPLEFWGMGIVEPALSLMAEGNAIRNQRRDNVNMIVNAMMEIREGEIDDEEDELVFRPLGAIHSRSGDAVRFLQPPMVTQDSHAEESKVGADIARVTGTSGPISGQSDPRVSSASGTSLLQKAQLLRLGRAIKREALAFKRVLRQMSALNDQFMPLDKVFAILGPKFFPKYYKQGAVACAMHVDISIQPAGIYANEEVLRQQFVNMMNIVGANPMMSQLTDWEFLLKRLFKLHGIEDVQLAMKEKGTVDVMETMFAMQENNEMATGGACPPAQPEDDHDLHEEIHNAFQRVRPDLWQVIGQHLATHQAAEMQQQMMLQSGQSALGSGGDNGPGSAPPGAGGGTGGAGGGPGLNPNRQSQPTSQNSISAQSSRMAPRSH